MARQKLTTGRIKDFTCPESGQTFLWDSDVPGLGIRATPGGKVYIYQGRFNGKTIRVKIGDVRTWVIESNIPEIPGARQEARRIQALIDKGIDPRIEKQERIAVQETKRAESLRHEVTVDEVWPIYIKERSAQWSERHLKDHIHIAQSGGKASKTSKRETKPGPLYSLMSMKLSDLTPERIKGWAMKEAADRGTQTRIAFDSLRAFVNWCEDHPDYKGLACPEAFTSRIKRLCLPKKKAKTDCLQREQLTAWFKTIRELNNFVISAYLQALLLTGARRNELAELKWEDVDFKWKSLTIRDKVDGERTIPLTPYVSYLLSLLPRRNQWVFSSPTSITGKLQEPRKSHNKALAVAGIDDLTIHGLRRSFGTLSEWIEVPAGVVAQIMGHKPSATAEKHYRQRPLDLLRMWHSRIEAWILEQAEIEQPETTETSFKLIKIK